MAARPLYLGTDVLQRARDLEFRQRADRDIWKLGFDHQAESDITGLSKLIEPPPLELQAAPEQEPLPIVVSDRPDALALQRQAQERQAPQQPMMQPQQQAPAAASGMPAAMPVASDPEGQRMPTSERAANLPQSGGEYRAYARQVAQAYGLDPDIFERQINQESGFQQWGPDGRPLGSSAGAQGIAQFMPGTAASYGVDVNDPYSSLEGAARHMRDLLRANNGNYRMALAAYNAGQGNVDKYGEGVFGDDFANGETKRYVQNILGGGAPVMPRLSLNAAPADAPGRAAPPAPAGVSSAPGAPPAPWEQAEAQGDLMLKENDGEDVGSFPTSARQIGNTGADSNLLPGDGGTPPTPEYDPRQYDEGARESRPAPIPPTDTTVTDPAYTQSPTGMTYGPVEQGEVQGPQMPVPGPDLSPGGTPIRSTREMNAERPYDPRVYDEGRHEADPLSVGARPVRPPSASVTEMQVPRIPSTAEMFSNVANGLTPGGRPWSSVLPGAVPPRGSGVAPAAFMRDMLDLPGNVGNVPDAALASVYDWAQEVRKAAEDTGQAYDEGRTTAALVNGLWTGLQAINLPWKMAEYEIDALLPDMATGNLTMGQAITNIDMLNDVGKLIAWGVKVTPKVLAALAQGASPEYLRNVATGAARAAGSTLREGAEALGRGLQGVGREVAGGLMDLNPGMAPRMAEGGPGIGRSMPGPDDVPTPPQRGRRDGQQRLTVRELTGQGAQRDAFDYVDEIHRHNAAPQGDKSRWEVVGEDGLRHGVATAGRPNSRMLDDGVTLEVTRVATDGTPNAVSALYGAVRRAAPKMDARTKAEKAAGAPMRGYQRLVTFTLESEPGTSLRASGWTPVAVTSDQSWSRPSRPRADVAPPGRKIRWEIDLTRSRQPVASDEALAILERNRAAPETAQPTLTPDSPSLRLAQAPERPVYSPEPPAGVQRRYHGTAGAFERPDPSRFDENGLYGPGYYTTSDPRVAGSYAENGMPFPPDAFEQIPRLEAEIAQFRRWAAEKPDHPAVAAWLENADEFQQAVDGLRDGTAWRGANVRAIDVPADLRLLDVDAPLDPALLDQVEAVIDTLARRSPDVAERLREATAIIRDRLANGGVARTNDAVVQELFNAAERIPGMGKGLATEVLQRAGYDGIAHQGGRRVPMLDSDGRPIEHDVTVIFPDRLDRVRNAFSGEKGGAFLPGFDPSSAAMGGAAGALSEDEQGQAGDPLRTAAGVFIAGLGNSRYGRRFVANAARNAKPGPPPNLWEIMQGFRFSWGMLGNLAQTGLVNVAGGPVELAKGLPTEAVRMSLLRGRPIGTAHYAAEVASGLKDGARNLLATVLGEIPPSVRNAPDFRPPMSERLAGRMGQVGNVDTGAVVGEAIDLPGRLSSQAPDSLWRPLFLKAGAAKERNTIMAENGISKMDPAAQWRELQRLANNPTPQEAQRIADAARKHADEMGLKGDAGFFERKLSDFMRGGKITTSADPLQAQIHEAAGSFIMPFLGAVYKLHKLAATRVPGLGFVANSKLPLDEKISRQVVGAATIYMLADYAAQGMITGPGPSDPDEAAIVNKKMPPHSWYAPGIGWVPNDSMGSLGPYLNAIGGYYDARRYATEKDKTVAGKGDESTVKYVLRGFERFPVVQAAQSVIAMAESPIKGVSDFAANAASSFAPAPYRTYQASQDQYARSVDREAGMDGGIVPALAEQTRQKIVSRVGYAPGLGAREDLPPALDRFGRPIENERQGVSAFLPRVSNPKPDALTDIFTRAGIEPGMPPAEIDDIPLNTEQRREWLRVRGEWLASKQDILSRAADYPEARRKNVFADHMETAAIKGRTAVRRMFTPAQRAAALQKKKAS